MYHIILVGLACLLLYLSWKLVHYSPRVLSMILPRALTFTIGLGPFVLSIFSAFAAASGLKEPLIMLQCFVQGYVGLWLMLATTAGMRVSYNYEQMLMRLFGMMGLVMTVIIASLYIGDDRLLAMVNLVLIGGGLWITTNYLRFIDRGSFEPGPDGRPASPQTSRNLRFESLSWALSACELAPTSHSLSFI